MIPVVAHQASVAAARSLGALQTQTLTAHWRVFVLVYLPVAYFTVQGALFEAYRATAWLLKKLGAPE